jgi:rRNA maturation RNase YbeY
MSAKNVSLFSEHPYGSPELDNLTAVAERVLQAESWEFNVRAVVVDDPGIRRLNRLFLGLDEVTDVIAFSADEDEGPGGEVYISLDQAREQALEASESVQRALQRLLVHGILHLGGWDDATDSEREKMLEYGEQYLSNR